MCSCAHIAHKQDRVAVCCSSVNGFLFSQPLFSCVALNGVCVCAGERSVRVPQMQRLRWYQLIELNVPKRLHMVHASQIEIQTKYVHEWRFEVVILHTCSVPGSAVCTAASQRMAQKPSKKPQSKCSHFKCVRVCVCVSESRENVQV